MDQVNEQNAAAQTMVALDNMNKTQIYEFLESLPSDLPWIKIGLEQYLAHGKDLIRDIYEKYDKRIFLDLKLHDIPNTVAKALGSLSSLPVEFITVHLTGGEQMLKAAQVVRNEKMDHVNILGVSYLTSLDESDLASMWGITEPAKAFSNLFNLALKTGTQGIVSSAHELDIVKECEWQAGKSLIKVCPGIRFKDEIEDGATSDQKRVLDPESAFKKGANYLVMGRSLTQAKDLSQRIEELKAI